MYRSYSDSVAVCQVLPALWVTLCFYTVVPEGQNQAQHYNSKKFSRWRYQFDVRLQCLIEFIWRCNAGGESGICDCLIFCSVCCTATFVMFCRCAERSCIIGAGSCRESGSGCAEAVETFLSGVTLQRLQAIGVENVSFINTPS